MAVKILIQHTTVYSYNRPVVLSTHTIRLKPAAHCNTFIEAYSLTITPSNHIIHWLQDVYGNFEARVDFVGTVERLVIGVDIKALLLPVNPFNFFVDDTAQDYPFAYSDKLKKGLAPYLDEDAHDDAIVNWLQKINRATRMETITFLSMLTSMVYNDIAYNVRLQPGVQTPQQSLSSGTGSCRDSAWLLVQILRHLHLAARFVSGYIVQFSTGIQQVQDGDGGTTGLHAWAEVYIPGAGWIGLDPSNGLFAAEGYVPLACTPHFEDAAAVTGTSEVCETELTFSNRVTVLSNDNLL
jgi:transglutaminase-like putative cysteine protease